MKQQEEFDKKMADAAEHWRVSPPALSYHKISKRLIWVNFWKFGLIRILADHKKIAAGLVILFIISSIFIFHNTHPISSFRGKISPDTKNDQFVHSANESVFNNAPSPNSNKTASQHSTVINPYHTPSIPTIHEKATNSNPDENTNDTSADNTFTAVHLKNENLAPPEDSEMGQQEHGIPLYFMKPRQNRPTFETHAIASESSILSSTSEGSLSMAISGGSIWNIRDFDFEFNTPFENKKFFSGIETRAELRFQKGLKWVSAGIEASAFSLQFDAEQLIFNPLLQLVLEPSGSQTLFDSTGYWHYFYIADSTIHVVDSVWEWDVDTTVIQLYDTGYAAHYDTLRDVQWSVNYQRFSVPVLLGFSITKGRMQFSAGGGFSVDLLKLMNGNIYGGPASAQAFIPANTVFPEKMISISLLGMASAGYFLTERTVLEFKPLIRYQCISFRPAEYNINSGLFQTSFSLGLRYYF
jgi:hypothetical protein